MFAQLRTLRFRLTLVYVVIFGVIQAVLWLAVDATRTSYLYRNFDTVLEDRAQGVCEVLDALHMDPGPLDERARIQAALRPVTAPDSLYEIRGADGALLVRSRELGAWSLASDATTQPAGAPETTYSTAVRPDLGSAQEYRIIRVQHDGPSTSPYAVYLAANLDPLLHMNADLRNMLLIFFVVSLVVAAIVSWYMARRSLAPLAAIARRAKELSLNRLEERIPVPRTGDEVAEMVTVINEMLARLEGEFRNQQRFISEVSHELRTPLAVLIGEAQALKRNPNAAATCDGFVKTVEEESRRMLRIAESFMILTRVRAGARPGALREASIEDVVLSAIQKAQPDARRREVTIRPKLGAIEGAAEPIVTGDPDLLESMVVSLLRNAIRHSKAGEVVGVGVASRDGTVEIGVTDHGPAIPVDMLPRVFDLFRQVRGTNDPTGDVGVELSIAKGVAELHAGTITAQNCPEGGCEFSVRLPQHAAK